MFVRDLATHLGVYCEYLPASPDTCSAVFSTGGGVNPGDTVLGYDNPTFQIRCRGANQETAFAACTAVYHALQGMRNTTLGTTYVISIQAVQTAPVNIGRDSQDRAEYTQNYTSIVRHLTTHRPA